MLLFETLELISWIPRTGTLAELPEYRSGSPTAVSESEIRRPASLPTVNSESDVGSGRPRPRLAGLVELINRPEGRSLPASTELPVSNVSNSQLRSANELVWDGPATFGAARIVMEKCVLIGLQEQTSAISHWMPLEFELMESIARAFDAGEGAFKREVFQWPPIAALAGSPLIQEHLPTVWMNWWHGVTEKPVLLFTALASERRLSGMAWMSPFGDVVTALPALAEMLENPKLKAHLMACFKTLNHS